MRFFRAAAVAAACLIAISSAAADPRETLGTGRLFNNDAIVDGQDRWRTGSYVASRVRGPAWTGTLPEGFGSILEYRFRGDLIAPENLVAPAPGDRRYAGVLSFGVHTHFTRGGADLSLGFDLVATGPQTRLDQVHKGAHDLVGIAPPSPTTLANQIGNGLYPTVTAEAAWPVALGQARFRPFVQAQAGIETLVRVGGDFLLGGYGTDALLLRDVTTGQLYPGVRGSERGLSMVLGGDAAWVGDSVFLPSGGAATLSETRTRLRAGVQWQSERTSVFYGVTWLSPEFDQQAEGQLVGSVRIGLRF